MNLCSSVNVPETSVQLCVFSHMHVCVCVAAMLLLLYSFNISTCNNSWTCASCMWVHFTCPPLTFTDAVAFKRVKHFEPEFIKTIPSPAPSVRNHSPAHNLSPSLSLFKQLRRAVMKSFTGTEASISLKHFPASTDHTLHNLLCISHCYVSWGII